MAARREIDIDASPEEVWEAIATEDGRERWLDEGDREVEVVSAQEPHRLVWRWTSQDLPPTIVEFTVEAVPAGSRVVVTETVPVLPLATLAASLMAVPA